jgi:hypothetical protein
LTSTASPYYLKTTGGVFMNSISIFELLKVSFADAMSQVVEHLPSWILASVLLVALELWRKHWEKVGSWRKVIEEFLVGIGCLLLILAFILAAFSNQTPHDAQMLSTHRPLETGFTWLVVAIFGTLFIVLRPRYFRSLWFLFGSRPPMDFCYDLGEEAFRGSKMRDPEILTSDKINLHRADADTVIALISFLERNGGVSPTRGDLRKALNSKERIEKCRRETGIPRRALEWVAYSNFAGQGIRDEVNTRTKRRIIFLCLLLFYPLLLGGISGFIQLRRVDAESRTLDKFIQISRSIRMQDIIEDFISKTSFVHPLDSQGVERARVAVVALELLSEDNKTASLDSLRVFVDSLKNCTDARILDRQLQRFLSVNIDDHDSWLVHWLQGRINFALSDRDSNRNRLALARTNFMLALKNPPSIQAEFLIRNGLIACDMVYAIVYSKGDRTAKWDTLIGSFKDIETLREDFKWHKVQNALRAKIWNNHAYILLEFAKDFLCSEEVDVELRRRVERQLRLSGNVKPLALFDSIYSYIDLARTHAPAVETFWESSAQLELVKTRWMLLQRKISKVQALDTLLNGRFLENIDSLMASDWDHSKLKRGLYREAYHWSILDSLGKPYPDWIPRR